MHINSRSLSITSDNIQSFLTSLYSPPDVLTMTEAWLSDRSKHLHEIISYHSYHLVIITRAQGGVTAYAFYLLNSEQLDDLDAVNDLIEINTVKITTHSFIFFQFVLSIYQTASTLMRMK